jgi:hypothetical protein
MHQIEYTNKPSITTLKAAIKKAAAKGETWIQLIWGENQITIERTPYGWTGQGWIGRNGGQDLANELQRARQKLAEELQRTAHAQQRGKA